MPSARLILSVLAYVLLARACLQGTRGRGRIITFALLNLGGIWWLFYQAGSGRTAFHLAAYVLLTLVQFTAFYFFAERKSGMFWISFAVPLAGLIAIKYCPEILGGLWTLTGCTNIGGFSKYFIGLSYLAFRTSYLAIEVRSGKVAKPGLWEYLAFCFFIPTLSVGPINSYSQFSKGFAATPDRAELPVGRSFLRILVGATKFIFLANLCNQLGYAGLMLDGHPHSPLDLFVAAASFYLYLYCNFSGFCDIAIGMAGLIGFPVEENFDDPLLARNLQIFWNRWHITLGRYFRDVVFTPLSKQLVGLFGVKRVNGAVAIAIFTVFVLVGIWHGVGWRFAIFGAANGIGLVTVHYYGILLRKYLGKEKYKRYLAIVWIRVCTTTLTFAYVSACLFLFANEFSDAQTIFSAIE